MSDVFHKKCLTKGLPQAFSTFLP